MTRRQCKACPWKRSTVPERDIPGGYCAAKHARLSATIAEPASMVGIGRQQSMMACHETREGGEKPCVGWLAHQLGPGDNLALRMRAMADRSLGDFETVGPQHERFEDTLPEDRR